LLSLEFNSTLCSQIFPLVSDFLADVTLMNN
jgi:hypothetical protein